MLRKLTFMLGVALPLAAATPALAGEVTAKAPGVLADVAAWAKPLSDGEMGELRGGFAGFAFNVIMSGTIAQLADDPTGATTTGLPPNVSISSPMSVFELLSKIDLPTANTVFCFFRPHILWMLMLHCG